VTEGTGAVVNFLTVFRVRFRVGVRENAPGE
jgi:hypothetical protein